MSSGRMIMSSGEVLCRKCLVTRHRNGTITQGYAHDTQSFGIEARAVPRRWELVGVLRSPLGRGREIIEGRGLPTTQYSYITLVSLCLDFSLECGVVMCLESAGRV